ncbi:F-box/FBD/LRR-repeat protein [Camellia lanceoleosa]|uniref:F-box/FBD/LRR-repeat protein n=1 Tax=Camellia lanceoleosa TaxID=1840588 RepID=A0ACC0GDT6_9ERIC|nr:F-box/FBD/LRR-repeat protein [Camellia lanceoleosa]
MTDRRIYRRDQISELPRNIIEGILERMPIRDAARTSILSTKWRSIWTTISQLKLGNQFFKDTLKIKPMVKHELVSVVEKILLLHDGPIPMFLLCIPRIRFDCSADIDRWILFLSRNGIKDLTLINNSDNEPYKLHSCIYSCPELTRLELVNGIFKAPRKSSGFHNLISLHLKKIAFARNILRTLFSMSPLLQRLTIKHCTGIGNLNIQAPKLKRLLVLHNTEIQSICFTDTQNLSYITIIFGLTMGSPKSVKTPNVVRFLGDLPRIAELNLDGFFIKILAAGGVPHRLPTTANLLKTNWFCILVLSSKTCIIMERNDEELVLNRLEAPNCLDRMLDKLQSVKISYVMGLEPELLFIKLLLARSPMLETIFIQHSAEVDFEKGFSISKELARFPRVSPKAAIIY